MTVMDNILSNLRRFFGMDDSTTPQELDQRLEDYVTPPAVEAEENQGAEIRAEETEPAQEPVQANLEPLMQQIFALEREVEALRKKAAAQPAAYEETPAETGGDPRERYFCSTTLKAMGRM